MSDTSHDDAIDRIIKSMESAKAPQPSVLSINDVVAAADICRDTVYALIRRRQLRAKKLGRRTVVLRTDFDKFLTELPEIELPAE